ncbi:amidohydrolase [Gilvimarinus agarilyticus]|uniref:amidohydrolase n=1 Tax=Gilvimarinus agarilyticus TaxID=679259 RepID=UPI0005A1550A|nr:amidohydrolase [Gilvimarinus agarilyticus]
METLRVALLQSDIIPDNPAANLAALEQLLDAQFGACANELSPDLIVLPEVFTTGFHPRARQHAETADGPVSRWLMRQAERYQAAITGSVVYTPSASDAKAHGARHTNRLLWASPNQPLKHYDKRHLFRMAGEHERYQAGLERTIINVSGWRVLVQVCYDLRFPVFSRNRDDYDIALYVANWPAGRHDHWRTLLKARAIENQAYVIGVNRVGQDAYDQSYAGGSVVFSPEGAVLIDAADIPGVVTTPLSAQALNAYRERFPAHLDADGFTLVID